MRRPESERLRRLLVRVAARLGAVGRPFVFVGGAVSPHLITDPGAPDARGTKDADAVLRADSRVAFDAVQARLRAEGWRPDTSPGAPICRWRSPDADVVDLMPDDASVLGFSNPWYRLALDTRMPLRVGEVTVPVVRPSVFVLTKIVAFEDRGRGDLFGSHDLEDLVTVFDGRPELDGEMLELPVDARTYAAAALGRLLAHPDLVFALPGHVDPTSNTEVRADAIHRRWQRLVERLRIGPAP